MLVLGAEKPEADAKLLMFMSTQNHDKFHKWLYKVLLVMSELMASVELDIFVIPMIWSRQQGWRYGLIT